MCAIGFFGASPIVFRSRFGPCTPCGELNICTHVSTFTTHVNGDGSGTSRTNRPSCARRSIAWTSRDRKTQVGGKQLASRYLRAECNRAVKRQTNQTLNSLTLWSTNWLDAYTKLGTTQHKNESHTTRMTKGLRKDTGMIEGFTPSSHSLIDLGTECFPRLIHEGTPLFQPAQ